MVDLRGDPGFCVVHERVGVGHLNGLGGGCPTKRQQNLLKIKYLFIVHVVPIEKGLGKLSLNGFIKEKAAFENSYKECLSLEEVVGCGTSHFSPRRPTSPVTPGG